MSECDQKLPIIFVAALSGKISDQKFPNTLITTLHGKCDQKFPITIVGALSGKM